MATVAGKLMVLQYEDPQNAGTWINLCGIDQMTFSITNAVSEEEKVPCTDRSEAVQTIRSYGAQAFSASYSGLFDTAATGTMVATAAADQDALALRAFVPGYGWFEADAWFISSVQWEGAASGSLRHSAELSASGAVTFTAVS